MFQRLWSMAHLKQQDVVPWCFRGGDVYCITIRLLSPVWAVDLQMSMQLCWNILQSIDYGAMDYNRCRSAAKKKKCLLQLLHENRKLMILIASCCGNSLCISFRKSSALWCEIPVCQTTPEVTSKNTLQTVSLGPVLLRLDPPVWFLSLLSTLSSHTHTHTHTHWLPLPVGSMGAWSRSMPMILPWS